MKLPARIHEISLKKEIEARIYPPHGFLPFEEANLGNGDYFGLYWEFGKEDQEPIVCEMIHEEGTIAPRFSSLDKFLAWYEAYEGDLREDVEHEDDEIEDPNFVYPLLYRGDECVQQNKIDQAIAFYRQSTAAFGELSMHWYKLATQLKRIGNETEFQKCIIQSILSNWAIEFPSQNAVRMLKALKPVEELRHHPLLKNRGQLGFDFGGKKDNKDYPILREIVAELHALGEIDKALLLDLNYATKMHRETSAFQERYGFDEEEWKLNFSLKTHGKRSLG